MHRGYVKVWRKIIDSGLIQSPNTLAVFMHILLNASHKDIKVGTTTGIVELKRGQYISGRKQLARQLEQSERQIRTSLDRLINLQIMTIKTTNKYSIYVIENYNNYQDSDQQTKDTATNKRPANDQQTTTKQECKEFNNVNNKYIPPIPAELFIEYQAIRKSKGAKLFTERMFNTISKQALLAGITTERAITICCEKGWTGFEASWIKQDKQASTLNAALSVFKPQYIAEQTAHIKTVGDSHADF